MLAVDEDNAVSYQIHHRNHVFQPREMLASRLGSNHRDTPKNGRNPTVNLGFLGSSLHSSSGRRSSILRRSFARAVPAAVFTVGRVPLDLYLSHAVGSGYGAAASVVVFLMWIYIAAQIFYLGGEFARLYANTSSPCSVTQLQPPPR